MGLPLTFNQQTFKLRYSSPQRFIRLYLPADFAQHTAGRAVVYYIKLFADFFKLFPREALSKIQYNIALFAVL